jgi:hypothetical protein
VTPTKRRILFVGIALATLGAACWERVAERNDERAHFERDGHLYRVHMTGLRFPLVHDPVSLLTARTRESTFSLELPRITGVVEGTEIERSAGYYYLGRVVITGGKMNVDLYFPDEGSRRALSWNGDYTLVAKEIAATR